MEIRVIKEFDNPFFKRKDLVLDVLHHGEATPKKDEVRKEIAGKYNVDEAQVEIDFIMGKQGLDESQVKVKILEEKPIIVEEKKEEKISDEEASQASQTPEETAKEE